MTPMEKKCILDAAVSGTGITKIEGIGTRFDLGWTIAYRLDGVKNDRGLSLLFSEDIERMGNEIHVRHNQ